MKRKYSFVKNPFVIVSVITLVIIVSLPSPFSEYKIKSTYKTLNNGRIARYFVDFKNDGESEMVRFRIGQGAEGGSQVLVSSVLGNIIFKDVLSPTFGVPIKGEKAYVSDIYNSGENAMAFFTHKNDSVFLFVFTLRDTNYAIYGLPVALTSDLRNNTPQMHWLGEWHNKLGESYLYYWADMSMKKGLSQIMRVCLNTGEIISNSFESINPQLDVLSNDSNHFSIVVNTVSNEKIENEQVWEFASIPHQLIVLDESLQLKCEPLIMGHSYSCADMAIVPNADGTKDIFTLLWNFSIKEDRRKICKFNARLEPIFEKNIDLKESLSELLIICDPTPELYLKSEELNYWHLDSETGDCVKSLQAQLYLDGNEYITSIQLDHKPFEEHVLYNVLKNEIIITQHGFKYPATYLVQDQDLSFDQLAVRYGASHSLLLPGKNYVNRLLYKSTSWLWLKYPVGVLLLILVNLSVWIRRRYKHRRQLELKITERQITDLQLQNFRNQLDPHFTFNALNVIGSVIYKENKEVAYDYFTRFSRLMRLSLLDSTKITRELESEIQFTIDYLEFQRFRFKDRFTYDIQIEPNVNVKMLIPKMLIQGYAENAVRHGFNNVDFCGKIEVRIENIKAGLRIMIEDNGIGRAAAKKSNPNADGGRGMNVMAEQIRLFDKFNNQNVQLIVHDKKTAGMAKGTIIEIVIPYDYTFTISRS